VGGPFAARISRFCKSDAGELDNAWTANANGTVNALLVDGDDLFVGVSFSNLGWQSKFSFGKVGTAALAVVASFNPVNNEASVNTFALAKSLDGNLLVRGSLTRIGGQFRCYAAN